MDFPSPWCVYISCVVWPGGLRGTGFRDLLHKFDSVCHILKLRDLQMSMNCFAMVLLFLVVVSVRTVQHLFGSVIEILVFTCY